MSRKHMPLIVGGVVVAVLSAAIGFLTFQAKGSYAEQVEALDGAQNKLKKLSGRPVFPSEANVELMGKQLETYEGYLDGLFGAMRAGQKHLETPDRDGFRQLLDQTMSRLFNMAKENGVTVPANFWFGFQLYAGGNPPAEEDLGRLADQLKSVAALCEILYQAGISEVVEVERAVFEKTAQAIAAAPAEEESRGRRSRGRGEPEAEAPKPTDLYQDPGGLFTKERYVLAYRAKDEVNWKVLDLFSKIGTPYVVVTKLEIVNAARPAVLAPRPEGGPLQPGGARPPAMGGPATPGGQAPEILPRELRVVAGQELPLVRLEVDLYRFAEETVGQEVEGQP